MEQICQKCGATVNSEQAFCSKCGAVVGMGEAPRSGGDEWDMASTFVSKKSGTAPLPQRPPATAERVMPAALDAPGPAHTDAHAATPARGGNNTMVYAVVGFVVVLLVGGLLILLFYLNSRG
jgi:hypothetical protein